MNQDKIGKTKVTEKQKKMVIYITIFVLTIIVIGGYFLAKVYLGDRKTDSEKVIEYMEELGRDFYENYYYSQLDSLKGNLMIEDTTSFLKNFEQEGISVPLTRVIELHFRTEKAINKQIGKYKCDFSQTKFIIYPQSPYEKKSYKLEPHIMCNNLQ